MQIQQVGLLEATDQVPAVGVLITVGEEPECREYWLTLTLSPTGL